MNRSGLAYPQNIETWPVCGSAIETSVHSHIWQERRTIFEVASTDREFIAMAERVLGHSTDLPARGPCCRWRVEPGAAADSWVISAYGAGDTVLRTFQCADRERALHTVEWDALAHLIDDSHDVVAVHAALLSRDGRGLVIVGPSFSGKSTLAIALWRSGWTLHGDECVFLHGDSASGVAARRRISLRDSGRDLVGEQLWQRIQRAPSCIRSDKGYVFHAHELDGRSSRSSAQVEAIVFLARREGQAAPAITSLMNPAGAALALLPYAHKTRTLPFVEAMRQISPLAEKIPGYDFGRGKPEDMVWTIDAMFEAGKRAAVVGWA